VSADAGIGGGGIVVVNRRFGGVVLLHVKTRSMVLHLKTYYLRPSDHDYQHSLQY
jgi:hypothetical protein